ncbi:hexokinase-4-like isoform X2 [Tachypleus tridentatus]|uniref:hexokinase-4-like isoform X2 n=1 Tax=Tachypleus tridentatus TaxID=6853 RepID=UPI003FD63EC6
MRKVNKIVSTLVLTSELIRQILDTFESEMELGLMQNPPKASSLQMENTFIPELPNGKENGDFLALDLGGTNFRVILIRLKPGHQAESDVQYYTVPESVRIEDRGEPLFDFLAECIHDFMEKSDLLEKHLPLGFCFSFPMVQKALDIGILVTWTKSFNIPSVVGEDAVKMLNDAIERRGDLKVDVVAVVNDTTGTLIEGASVDPHCAIGLILGTGCNACYLEKVERIKKWEGEHPGIDEVVVDIEWGAFGDNGVLDFMKTEFDKIVDNNSLLVNSFTFEKLFAGKYLGELVRQVLLCLIDEKLLFRGKLSNMMMTHNAFTTEHVSEIESEDGERKAREILENFGYPSVTDDDLTILRHICAATSVRGARIVSICLASLLNRMKKKFVTIAIDGSLYNKHPKLHQLMTDFIAEMAPEHKFKLMLAEDGSGKGAGLVAAIAERLKAHQHKTEA